MLSPPDRWLRPLDASLTQEQAGGKAYTLARVARSGFRVPRSEVLASEALREARAGGTLKVPEALEQHLREAFARLARDRGAVAVRSSGIGEDGKESSLAGHFDSVLGVRSADGLVAGVLQVWESYRRGPEQARTLGGVLLQEMLPADVSGVFFTRSPLPDGEDECLVESAFGLGDGVVAGRMTPDVFRLARADGRLLGCALAAKRHRSRTKEGSSGTAAEPLPESLRRAPSLDQARLEELHATGIALEQALGEALDIEFCYVDDSLYILQARPITSALPDPDDVVWTAANSQEVLPRPVTPLTWSLFHPLIEQGRADLFAALDLHEPQVRRYLSLFYGRPYFNRMYFKEFIAQTPGVPLEVFDALIFGRGEVVDFRRPPLTRLTLKILAKAAYERAFAQQRLERFIARFDAAQKALDARFQPHLDSRALLTLADETRVLMAEAFGKHVLGTAFAGAHLVFLRSYLETVGVPDAAAITNRLVHAEGSVLPAASSERLYALARLARQHPALAEAIEQELADAPDFARFATRIAALPGARAFQRGLDAFRREFGHRGVGEAELMQPRWAEDPGFVLATVRTFLRAPSAAAPERRRSEQLRRQRELVRSLEDSDALRAPWRRWIFRGFLGAANRFAAYRENLKHHALRGLALLRRIVLELAGRLVAEGVLEEPDDVFFLALAELRRALFGAADPALRGRIAARRLEHRANLGLHPPRFLYREEADAPGPERRRMAGFLTGSPLSPGRCRGRARVVHSAADLAAMQPGEVLVAPAADPGWTPLYYLAGGLAVDVGGVLSHAAVIAREYGVPAVAGLEVATRRIRTGDLLEVDGDVGQVRILRRAAETEEET